MKPAGHHRPHPYSADIGGVAASRRRAVADLSARDTSTKGGRWLLLLWALVPAAIALVGIIAGQFFGWLP